MLDGEQDEFNGNERLDQILLLTENPFSSTVVQSAWDETFDVASINKKPFEGIINVIKRVQEDINRKAKIILLLGDVGLGKTHLLSRIRKFANINNFYFIQIEPVPDIEKIYMHILREVISNLGRIETGEKYSFLEFMVTNLISKKFCLALERIGGSKKLINSLKVNPRAIFDLNFTNEQKKTLHNHVLRQVFRDKPDIDINLLQVLFKLTDPNLYFLAIKWLQCESLNEDELKELGVGSSLDDEMRALGALKSIFQISDRVILLAFDQLEGIITRFDLEGIQSFLQTIAMLYNGFPNHISLLSCQSLIWAESVIENVDKSLTDRISKQFVLENLTEEDVISLVGIRMNSIWKNAEERPPSSIYPFNKEYLINSATALGWNPRNLLNRLRDIFDQMQERGILEIPPMLDWPSKKDEIAPTETLDNFLLAKFKEIEENNYTIYVNSSKSKQEDIVKAAFYDLLRLYQPKSQNDFSIEHIIMNFKPIKTRKPIDIVAVVTFEEKRQKLGVNFHFSSHMSSLYYSLNRLNKYRLDGHLDWTFIARGDIGISERAVKTKQELKGVLENGLLINVNIQEGSKFYAVKRILDSISAREISYNGEPISVEDASEFIFSHILSQSLTFREFFNFCKEKLGIQPQIRAEIKSREEIKEEPVKILDDKKRSEIIENTRDILRRQKVITFEDLYNALTDTKMEEIVFKETIIKRLEEQGLLLVKEDDENIIIMADISLMKS